MHSTGSALHAMHMQSSHMQRSHNAHAKPAQYARKAHARNVHALFALHSQASKEHLATALSGFNAEIKMSKHHLIGCKAAKQRFSGILAIDLS